jgi:hypothetical protein
MTLFEQYLRSTPPRMHSTQGWMKYQKANAGAYDSAAPLRRRASRPLTFRELYGCTIDGTGKLGFDEMVRHGGNVFVNGRQFPECLEDSDPSPQHEVTSTDREPVDHEGFPSNRAPPFGKFDEPRERRIEEPKMAQDPIQSERQRRAMGAAASGNSRLGISPEVGRRFLHGDQIETELPSERTREPATVRAGQQGEQAEHEDEPQDEKLIRRVLKKLGFEDDAVEEAIARDRAGRRRMAGDRALARGGSSAFYRVFPEARGLTDGLPAFTPRVLW